MSAAAQADFGPTLVSGDGKLSTTDAMVGKKYVGIYFSAHWCPPCRNFTPALAEWYAANAAGLNLEIVFASSDNDEDAFVEYFAEMPWKALPYAARDMQAELSKKYKVGGIPSLIIIDAETGELCTTKGREGVSKGGAGLASFPWKHQAAPAGVAANNKHARTAALATSEPEPEPDYAEPEPEPDSGCETDDPGASDGSTPIRRGPWEILTLGEEVQLLEDPEALRSVFARFFDGEDGAQEGGDLSAEMEHLASDGVGVVVEVYEPDRSATLRLLKTNKLLECPFEVSRAHRAIACGVREFQWGDAVVSVVRAGHRTQDGRVRPGVPMGAGQVRPHTLNDQPCLLYLYSSPLVQMSACAPIHGS